MICSRQLLGNNTLSYRTMSPIRSPLPTAELLRKRSIPSWVLQGPPTRKEKRDANPLATNEEVEDAHAKAMLVYQLYNTAVWDLIGPTVSLKGGNLTKDHGLVC